MFDILLIIVVLLVIFGASKVRSAGSDLGAAVKGFRKALRDPGAPPPASGQSSSKSETADASANPPGTLPDAEFPEVLAARSRGSGKPGA